MIKAVIFDMDGVVIDSEPLYQQAEERLFAEYGITVPAEDWNIFRGVTEMRFYELIMERYGIPGPIDKLKEKGRSYVMSVFAAELDFCDGFKELIGWLRPRYATGLVTSTTGDILSWIDHKLGVTPYFQQVIIGGMTANSKPHPEPYLEMMSRLGVAPDETVVVEDSIPGLNSALASGAITVAISGSVPVADMPPAHGLIHSLREFTPAFLNQLNATRTRQEVS